MTRLLTAQDVADSLQVPVTWVYRAARVGDLPSVPCGRYRRFDQADVDDWIATRKTSSNRAVSTNTVKQAQT